MPKITSVEPQKKNPKRFNVFLDSQFAFGADEDLIVDFRLIPGKEIDENMLEKLLQEAEIGKLMERMYGLFNIRARSEKEIRNYLNKLSFKRKIKDSDNGVSEMAVSSLIDKLMKKGMINDKQFASSWVEARSKKYGPQRIRQELFSKGIDRETVDAVFSEQVTGDSKEKLAEQLLKRKIKAWKNLEPLKFKKKAYEFLMRRGFEFDFIKSVVEKFLKKV